MSGDWSEGGVAEGEVGEMAKGRGGQDCDREEGREHGEGVEV